MRRLLLWGAKVYPLWIRLGPGANGVGSAIVEPTPFVINAAANNADMITDAAFREIV